ncbi:MAG TPA: hypothetical protein VIT23_17260 [Terrimicrobiaceae bacterium]
MKTQIVVVTVMYLSLLTVLRTQGEEIAPGQVWISQHVNSARAKFEANDFQGATALVEGAIGQVVTNSPTVEALMKEVATSLSYRRDEFLKIVESSTTNYPALSAAIARGAARGAPHLTPAVVTAAGYGRPSYWERTETPNGTFFDGNSFQGIPGYISINPATWSPELLRNQNSATLTSEESPVRGRHESPVREHYFWPNGLAANPANTKGAVNSKEN